jgi:hypothetical protein
MAQARAKKGRTPQKQKAQPVRAGLSQDSGAGCRFRTGHLMITNQLLYQMS